MEICGLAVGYVAGKKTNVVLNDINLSLKRGELTCLLGANGVGKSTLLRTLTGAQPPLKGEIRVFGKPLRDYNQKQLSRLGDTPFEARSVAISMRGKSYFIPSSLLADLRREAIDRLVQVRQMAYRRPRRRGEAAVVYPASSLSYLGNVSNALARAFYHAHGVENIEPAYECLPVEEGALMFTRFCIKRQWGKCPREKRPAQDREGWKEPLYLQYRDTRLRLEFDCARCQMRLYRVTPSRG